MKKIIKESQLRSIIRESLKKALNEYDINEPDEWPDNDTNVRSFVTIAIDPKTLDYEYGEQDSDKYINVNYESSDFPYAYSYYNPGDYFNPPQGEDYIGECGGNFDYDPIDWPEEYNEDEIIKIVEKFTKENKDIIIEYLEQHAEIQ